MKTIFKNLWKDFKKWYNTEHGTKAFNAMLLVLVLTAIIWCALELTTEYCNPTPKFITIFAQQLQAEPIFPWSNIFVYLIDKYAFGIALVLVLIATLWRGS